MSAQPKELRPLQHEMIPEPLRSLKRWAPWEAIWNEKRGKYDKVPRRADNTRYGLSTARPESWFTFEAAVAACKRDPNMAGVGLVLTGLKDFVGVDLDDCIDNGVVQEWATEVVMALDSYTEVSPSGNGLRVFVEGTTEDDWNNHDRGIEVYSGHDARFLTMTGNVLWGTPNVIKPAPEGVLPALAARYAKTHSRPTVVDINTPDLIEELLLPDVRDLELDPSAKDFLIEGDTGTRGDRSGALHAAAIELYRAGLSDAEVFSVLATNEHAMTVALDHRRQDQDRAMQYLWREHCLKAKPKARPRVATVEDFEDVSGGAGGGSKSAGADGKTSFGQDDSGKAVADAVATTKRRFAVEPIGTFLQRPAPEWRVKGVLPKRGLCMVFGESGSGKTFFIVDLVGCIARGEPWRGHRTAGGKVVYLCAEGEAGFRNRLAGYQLQNNGTLDMGVIGGVPNFLEKTDVKDLITSIRAFGKTDVIVVDTLAQVTPGANENSGEDMGRALAHCRAIGDATGALVVLIHHAGKDTSKGARGWSGIRAAADAEIEVLRAEDARCATVTKLKDGEDGASFGFTLKTVQIGVDADGDPITTCVVDYNNEVVEKKGKTAAPRFGDNEKTVLGLVADNTDALGLIAREKLIGLFVAATKKPAEGRDNRRTKASEAIRTLLEKGALVEHGDDLEAPNA